MGNRKKKFNAKKARREREVLRETTDYVMTVKKVEYHFEKSKEINNTNEAGLPKKDNYQECPLNSNQKISKASKKSRSVEQEGQKQRAKGNEADGGEEDLVSKSEEDLEKSV